MKPAKDTPRPKPAAGPTHLNHAHTTAGADDRAHDGTCPGQDPILELDRVCHRFGDGTIGLEDVCLSIPKGALVVIAGPNGSGKTTLLKHLNGLLLAQKGTVRVAGLRVEENLLRVRQTVGLVFQDADSQIVGETVAADVAFGPENLRLEREEIERRVTAALATVGLSRLAQQRPHLLSGGEKRRLCIAGVLAMQPQILALDEPFAGLDYPGTRQILEQILALHAAAHTIVITTHDVEKILFYTERLIVLEKGKIVRDGPPERIVTDLERFGVRAPCSTRMGLEVVSWLK
jgi:biotin transport system ATP-binding protein